MAGERERRMGDLKERKEKILISVQLGQCVHGCHHFLFKFLINKVKNNGYIVR